MSRLQSLLDLPVDFTSIVPTCEALNKSLDLFPSLTVGRELTDEEQPRIGAFVGTRLPAHLAESTPKLIAFRLSLAQP